MLKRAVNSFPAGHPTSKTSVRVKSIAEEFHYLKINNVRFRLSLMERLDQVPYFKPFGIVCRVETMRIRARQWAP